MENAVQPDITNEFLEALRRLKARTHDDDYRERVGRMIEKVVSGNSEGRILLDMFAGLAQIKGFAGSVQLIDSIEEETNGSSG